MRRDKRERDRLKRAEKRKARARREAQVAESSARGDRAVEAAWRADDLLRARRPLEAAAAAAQAIALAPRDRSIAALYVRAADRSRDLAHRVQAYEHLSRLVETEPALLIALADAYVSSGRLAQAREIAARARPLVAGDGPARGLGAALAAVERRCGDTRTAPPSASRETLPLLDLAAAAAAGQADAGADALPAPPPTPEAARPETGAPATLEIAVEVSGAIEGLAVLARTGFDTPRDVELGRLAARLRAVGSYDRLLAVEQARGLMRLSHQEETARRVLAVLLGRALLADEVGLGKTIEAGLILSEYLLRGHVESALILTPPSLVAQWREELGSKFGVHARTTDDPGFRAEPERFWAGPGVAIASLATARSPQHRDPVTGRRWDLVVVDEAHVLKNARTQAHTLVSRLSSRFLLLLTATPVENDVEELYNLVSLVRPGQLGGRAPFVRRFGGPRGRITEAARRELRGLLGEVMIRNTRALSGVRLPPRFARTVLVEPQAAERELYEHLLTALRALGPGGHTRLLLSVLLQEAGSSPAAVASTLGKLRDDPETAGPVREALAPAIALAARLPETGKGQALSRVLADGAGATVVFTRFRATLGFLHALLGARGVACERLDGQAPLRLRHEAVARCHRQGGVLLSSDVGSEGLNLQFCRRVVNFDLPWNPMRIEQRIGRVHRIGQEHPVDVVNFCLAGSIEERILRILDERINLFELVVGEVETILGYLDDERELPDLMLDAFAVPEPAERERRLAGIGDALAAARTRYQHVKAFDETLFRNELGV